MAEQARMAAARLQRVGSAQIRKWLATAALRATALVRSRESAEIVVRELGEFLGAADTSEMPLAKVQGLIRAHWVDWTGRWEPGEAELMANVDSLARLLGLDQTARDVLALFAAIPSNAVLLQSLERIEVRSQHQITGALAIVLDHHIEAIRGALSAESPLVRFHVLKIWGGAYDFLNFALLNDDLERALCSSQGGEAALLKAFFLPAPASGLNRGDYGHLEPRLSTLIAYLRGAEEAGARGVNVLLYGVAGTGKTELARLLAEELGWNGVEVKTVNGDGTASTGDERMASYWLAQRFLENSRGRLIIFDEIEDVFGQDGYGRARMGRLFVHRLLERNAVPTLWLCNEIDALSPAVRRRFDFSISFGPLPGIARRKVLERHLAGMTLPDGLAAQLLRREFLVPAQVATGRKVAKLAADESGAALITTIDASMRLMGQPIPRDTASLEFEAALCNADVDIEAAVQGLIRHEGKGSVALYGPPGVGKSALAGYFAERLDLRAVRIASSDLLSAFLGESEQRVTRLFDAIDVKTEAIVLEEADELLAARDGSRHSWEVRLANEVLIRMESFAGLIVLTTNALERIDSAALRRCALKVRLDTMRTDQRAVMWQRRVGQPVPDAIKERLERLSRLTAGDFAAVAAQANILGARWGPSEWLAALEKEVALRPAIARSAGFNS